MKEDDKFLLTGTALGGWLAAGGTKGRKMLTKIRTIFFLILIVLQACSGATTTQELLDANFMAKGQSAIDLLSPTENQQLTSPTPTLSWSSRGVSLYTLQVATDSNFTTMVINKEVNSTSYTIKNSDLIGVTSLATSTYYWRAKVARITDNLQSKTGTFFLVAVPTSGSGYAGALYVNASSTASTEVGSKEAPYRKIQNAMSAADSLRKGVQTISLDVLVAKGTYTEALILVPGISIRGGYEASGWTRNISGNVTTIQAPTDTAITGNSVVTAAYTTTTVVDGFTILGGPAATNYAIYLVSSSPTISNNTIIGGSGTLSNSGINNITSSPVISGNTITGNNGTGNGNGIINQTSSPIITNNTISGGSGTSSNIGISNQTSSPTISGNTITGGSSTFSNTGISNLTSSPTIINNAITGGSGVGSTNYGINNISSSAPAISNNTINGGTTGTIYGISLSSTSTPAIKNNIIFSSAGTGICINETAALNDPTAVQNNNLFGCATLYQDNSGGAMNNICAATGNLWTGAGCTGTQLTTPTGSGNVSINNAGNQLFVNFAGNDWHLTTNAAICDVRGGGLNLSGSFTTDKDLITRTTGNPSGGCVPANTGAAGWSMGEYESN